MPNDTDALLYEGDQKEALSRAYVRALASVAGYVTSPPSEFDRDSVDIEIKAGGSMRPQIHAQLKATTKLAISGSCFKFPLKKKNYDDLRVKTQAPRLLVVLALPPKKSQWFAVTANELIIRGRAYWLSLLGFPDLVNKTSVTIDIPNKNVFDTKSLKKLMENSRKGLPL